MSNTISAVTANAGTINSLDKLQGSAKQLDQNDFLKLLVTQIQYQDPMNPKSNTDMAAQMAQFTSLQQATHMSSSLTMLQANSLVGSTVNVQVDAKNAVTGTVSGVLLDGGTPKILVDGKVYDMSQITSVMPTLPTTTGSGTTAGDQTLEIVHGN
jgi:flagellar basal-body rod modification protein FlgD